VGDCGGGGGGGVVGDIDKNREGKFGARVRKVCTNDSNSSVHVLTIIIIIRSNKIRCLSSTNKHRHLYVGLQEGDIFCTHDFSVT
jgi:hypothetical protein